MCKLSIMPIAFTDDFVIYRTIEITFDGMSKCIEIINLGINNYTLK